MRCFFGLELEPNDKLAIDRWRSVSLPPLDNPVSADNLHITLAFLGQVEVARIEALAEAASKVRASEFSLLVDQLGYWPKPKTLWIGPTLVSPALEDLAGKLGQLASRFGLPRDSRPYIPHISLFRKQSDNPPAALMPPAFELEFRRFCLFESLSTKTGVRYRVLECWPLVSEMSIRDRLRKGRI